MVGSIDPRCETVRGIHWPKKGREVVWSSRRGKPSWPAVQSDRINRPDIWMQAIRSDPEKLLWHGGRPHMESIGRRKVVRLFGARVAENHLGQRSKATASTGRTYGCKRSDQTLKNSCGTGAVHIWIPGSLVSLAPRNDGSDLVID